MSRLRKAWDALMGREPATEPDVVSVGGVPVGRLVSFDIAATPGDHRMRIELVDFDADGLVALDRAWR